MRTPLCTYYSASRPALLQELAAAYRGAAAAETSPGAVVALVVPHGAACDSFHVAASGFAQLNAHLRRSRCSHLTAVLLGTEHAGSTPVAVSREDWATPLGVARGATAAVDWLAAHHGIPVSEAPHAREHSIENQLPFLLHGAACGWDVSVAAAGGCDGGAGSTQPGSPLQLPAAAQPAQPAQLSIVPISIGDLSCDPALIASTGTAVRQLLAHLRQQQQQQQQATAGASGSSSTSSTPAAPLQQGQVVLVVTSDFTHAGPWYRELPPAGESLSSYMQRQDAPVLQALQEGSSTGLLAAAAATRNSMCGLHPLAVALEALYGSGGEFGLCCQRPRLLDYRPAHAIFPRPDSTGFAALVVRQQLS